MTADGRLVIRPLGRDEVAARAPELAAIMVDAVASGAGVNFLAGFTLAESLAWWRGAAEDAAAGGRIVLVAERAGRIDGTVSLGLVATPNQPHRGEIMKMLVHRRARRQGLGAALLRAAEAEALARGRWLLILDTVTGSEADRLYRRLGWRSFGTVPDYALLPDGTPWAASFFWKDLRPAGDLVLAQEGPEAPGVPALLAESQAYSAALYPAASNHMLPPAALARPAIRLFVARRGGRALGCGALMIREDGLGELKSMVVAAAARGAGVGGALLARLEREAVALGLAGLVLETGILSAPALALYRRHGFTPREAFPPYAPDPWSVFMEKALP